MKKNKHILSSPIEYLKGVGPTKGELLKKEKQIFTFEDLLFDFPFKYADRTKVSPISSLNQDGENVQIRGTIRSLKLVKGNKPRLEAIFEDDTSSIKLMWFRGHQWIQKGLKKNEVYNVFGKVNVFRNQRSIPHPEMELFKSGKSSAEASFTPFYSSTEKLNAKGLDSKGRRRLIKTLLDQISDRDLTEYLPGYLIERMRLMPFHMAIRAIHLPKNNEEKNRAINRFKFEELFRIQIQLVQRNKLHKLKTKGFPFRKVGAHFHNFYQHRLPFELTNAQKKVIKEIRRDLGSGIQMNRLLQGDVGSGKTIVALMIILISIDNGYQACIMAPTEILALQHYKSISAYLQDADINVGFLSGNVKGKKRKEILSKLENGEIHIIIGTHAIIEDPVKFNQLGIAITDEQHRFGVKQRAKLWTKSKPNPPHILVMTATPIPRTLSMTLYGDLDLSIIDELPPGRKLIKTSHMFDSKRPELIKFVKGQIANGKQVYFVYPLIEESEKLDLRDLERGYERLLEEFPRPAYQISVVHGRQKPADKEAEMNLFANGKTNIMVATTVIEVGVNVPNASVMVIMNAERFGLSQLHQLRGRVGRGADQSYCILYSSYKLGNDAKKRISTMCSTNDGFKIAEVDLELRGPGDMIGTRQSGELPLSIANLATDGSILQTARAVAMRILEKDPLLQSPLNQKLVDFINAKNNKWRTWSQIS